MNTGSETALRDAYIDLVKRSVANFLYLGSSADFAQFNSAAHYDGEQSRRNIDPQSRPMSLLVKGQLDLIERSVVDLELRDVPGDFIEAGIWRGGAIILLRALLDAHGIANRNVYAADSFAGIPPSHNFRHDPVDKWADRWAASLDEVRGNIERFGLLDERIIFFPGFFEESLLELKDERFALIRLDSDSHDSVTTSLEHLYPRLSPGGIIIIDDWHLFGCKLAVENYRKANNVIGDITVDSGNAWWIKDN